MTRPLNDYKRNREKVRNGIREAGKWIQENADQIVNDVEGLTGMDIWIRYDAEDLVPEISVDAKYLSREVIRAMYEEKNDGSESDMEKKDPGSL